MTSERGPYVTTAVFCETVLHEASGVLTLVRIVDRMLIARSGPDAPEEMPPVQLDWTLVITLKAGDIRGSHPVKITPQLPSGETLQPMILPTHFEGESKGQGLITKMEMTITMPGIYWFQIHVNDELMTKVPLEVIYSRAVTPGQSQ